MLTLGIDPAYQDGAAVLLAGDGTCLGAWHWKISKRKAGVIWYLKGRHGDGIIIRSLGDIGQCINRVALSPLLILSVAAHSVPCSVSA